MISRVSIKTLKENLHNVGKKRKVLLAFDDMSSDLISNETVNHREKLNISLVFITQSYFKVRECVWLNSSE